MKDLLIRFMYRRIVLSSLHPSTPHPITVTSTWQQEEVDSLMQKRVLVEKIGKEVFCSKINGDELLLHISSLFPVSSFGLADSWRMMTVYCKKGWWGRR